MTRILIADCIDAVAEHYGLTREQIKGPSREWQYAHPRQLAMWLARGLTDRSLPDIGRHFGNRDHTTVLHAIRAVNERRMANRRFNWFCESLQMQVECFAQSDSLAHLVYRLQLEAHGP